MKNENEIVQYIVINKEVKMTAPKMAAQAGHVLVLTTLKHQYEDTFKEWLDNGQVKIFLGGKEKDLNRLIEQGFISIRDFGRTEIAENTLTAVALPPMIKSEAQKYVKRLQLLKDHQG